MEKYIHECYFGNNNQMPFDPNFSVSLMSNLLLCCLISKYEGKKLVINRVCEELRRAPEEVLLESGLFICRFKEYEREHDKKISSEEDRQQ
jgi:hypothetical protein